MLRFPIYKTTSIGRQEFVFGLTPHDEARYFQEWDAREETGQIDGVYHTRLLTIGGVPNVGANPYPTFRLVFTSGRDRPDVVLE